MKALEHTNIVKLKRVCFTRCAIMMEYLCFNFQPFGDNTTVSSLQDFLLCINDQDCVVFNDVVRHASTEVNGGG